MKIVVLDGHTMNPGDLDWDPLIELGEVEIFLRTSPDEIINRAHHASILVINKIQITDELLDALPNLRCICLMATGYDNVDIKACSKRNIPVYNAVGYSTNSVAQHVFSLILAFQNKVYEHNDSVHNGKWSECSDFSYTVNTIHELTNKTLGLYGFGKIGKRVARIAKTFGMRINVVSQYTKPDDYPEFKFCTFDSLIAQSDYLSIHAAYAAQKHGLFNSDVFGKMKSSAYLINTGRGGFVNESDLKEALINGEIAGAGLDVLSSEPPVKDHPLLGVQNCIITPHLAWASYEARGKLLKLVCDNIKDFKNDSGTPINKF